MKTPEQIAQQILDELDLGEGLREGTPKTLHDLDRAFQSGWLEGYVVLDMIVSAVQADRQQRPLLITPEQAHEWAGYNIDLHQLAERIPNSSIPDAVSVIAGEVEYQNERNMQ
jgi:hypothetical protein